MNRANGGQAAAQERAAQLSAWAIRARPTPTQLILAYHRLMAGKKLQGDRRG